MTGPQWREPRDPPDGVLGPAFILAILIAGAVAALAFALLLRP